MYKSFILASQSPQRKKLLEQINFVPEKIEPANIDETPKQCEKPSQYVKRMALEKAEYVAKRHKGEIVLASDTVIVCGAKIIQKSRTHDEQREIMNLLSGRTHKVLTAVCVINEQGKSSVRLNITKIKMKKLSQKEISDYCVDLPERYVGKPMSHKIKHYKEIIPEVMSLHWTSSNDYTAEFVRLLEEMIP